MIVCRDISPQFLYQYQLNYILGHGQDVEVHGKPTRELLDVATVIEEPRRRVHVVPGRRANPFLALSEALHLLAGRDDVASLLPYNKRILEFSDDGLTLYGAYGKRIHPQMGALFARLNNQPFNDRRAVLSIWQPEDLVQNTKDPPCLTGDTVIVSPEGNLPIRELVGKRYPIYTFDGEARKLAWATGRYSGTKATVKVWLDNGSVIQATPDHLFLTKTRKSRGFHKGSQTVYAWVPASELKTGQSLLPIHFYAGRKGHQCFSRNPKSRSGRYKISVHKAYWELLHGPIPRGQVVHHDNHNILDNRDNNLIAMPAGEHVAHHKAHPDGGKFKDLKRNTRKTDWDEETLLELGAELLVKYGRLTFHLFGQEYKGVVSGSVPQKRWGRWSNFVSAVVGNHKVERVTEESVEHVYDLTVEGGDCFFVAPGILVHNCNDIVAFKLRDSLLHMTVFNRSNDLHWGLYAVNIYQFSILQEYLAARLGVELGTQTHISNSLHIYTEGPGAKITQRMLAAIDKPLPVLSDPQPLFPNGLPSHAEFVEHCNLILDQEEYGGEDPEEEGVAFLEFASDFLRCYREHRAGVTIDLSECRHGNYYADWLEAAEEFLS